MSAEKRGKSWYARFEVDGQKFLKSLGLAAVPVRSRLRAPINQTLRTRALTGLLFFYVTVKHYNAAELYKICTAAYSSNINPSGLRGAIWCAFMQCFGSLNIRLITISAAQSSR